MPYEKTILDLVEKVAELEERIAALEGNKKLVEKPARGTHTDMIVTFIQRTIENAKEAGEHSVVLTSGEVQRAVGLKNRMPSVCNAMRKCMDDNSVILHETPSGNSSTFVVKWVL